MANQIDVFQGTSKALLLTLGRFSPSSSSSYYLDEIRFRRFCTSLCSDKIRRPNGLVREEISCSDKLCFGGTLYVQFLFVLMTWQRTLLFPS